MVQIWTLIGFLVVFGAVLLISTAADRSRSKTRARLNDLIAGRQPEETHAQSSLGKKRDRLPMLAKIMSNWHLTENLYAELAAAGWAIRPSEFLGIVIGGMIIGIIAAILTLHSLLSYFIFGLVGAAIPILLLKSSKGKARAAFNNQIIDALEMIASSLRSGFSFIRAMQMVAQELPPPISTEFRRVVYEINVGRPLDEALRGVVTRIGSYDFDLVVTAVTIQLQVGGNLADILETISSTLRDRIQVISEMNSLTAESRISAGILMLLPVVLAVALSVLNPKYMSTLTTDPLGHVMIGSAVMLQVIGWLIMKKMMSMDV
ncbi:MAG TPA: secretion system protein [Armatimonadetes bacterium]|nr:secretion system protein [Armatimonadota bacterium]